MAAVDMVMLFYSLLLPQQMLTSVTQITDFSEQKKTEVYLKQKETLVHLSLLFLPGDEVTHTRTWSEQKEMTQCPEQVLSTWPGGFHLGSAGGLPQALATF